MLIVKDPTSIALIDPLPAAAPKSVKNVAHPSPGWLIRLLK